MKLKNCKEGTIVIAKKDIESIPKGTKGTIVRVNSSSINQKVLVNWSGFTLGHSMGSDHNSYRGNNSWWVYHEDIKRYKEEV